MTEKAPATDPHYVLIQRINNPSLAVMYPDLDAATAALNEDQFIANICAKDAIDAVVSDDATGYTIVPRSSVVETRTVDPMGPIEDIIDAKVVEDEQADENDENAVRAVGNALNANKITIVVPCHRILTKDLDIGGYNTGQKRKSWLLQHEGI